MSDTIFSYLWFEAEFRNSAVKILFLSSEANPYAMAALWAAKKYHVRTCYVPHGFVAENPPRLHFDLNLLDGPALRKLYENSGAISGSVGYRGLPGPSAPMKVKSPGTIGFFLSLIYDEDEVVREINSAITTLNPARVLIRPHPNEVLGGKTFPHARIQLNSTKLLPTSSLDSDISECDLIFCGNSSVHLTILKRGVPTIQLREFDTLPFDTRQFIRNRIVYHAEKFPVSLSELSKFYGEEWSNRFREYDASYLIPEEERRSRIRDLLTSFSGNGKG